MKTQYFILGLLLLLVFLVYRKNKAAASIVPPANTTTVMTTADAGIEHLNANSGNINPGVFGAATAS